MKVIRALGLGSLLFVGHQVAYPEPAEASSAYKGYLRCEDIKVKDLVTLRKTSQAVSVKASTTLGSSTIDKRGSITPDETRKTSQIAFTAPTMNTHGIIVNAPTTADFALSIERDGSDTAELDVAVCIGYMRLSPFGDEQKSETVAKGSLLAGESSQLLWNRNGGVVGNYVILVQARSIATWTKYRIAVQKR